jgi:hypothetical protein
MAAPRVLGSICSAFRLSPLRGRLPFEAGNIAQETGQLWFAARDSPQVMRVSQGGLVTIADDFL